MGRNLTAISLAMTLLASACASAPQPSNAEIADACLLLQQNKPWHDTLREVARQWGAPMGYTLAVVKQESSFDSQALAPRGERQWFGLVDGKRVSSAAGYSQALDGTWEMYKKATGRWGANRNNFQDSSDFIGWYYNTNGQRVGIGQYDYRAHYLVYHEGATGYLNGSWKGKGWLVGVADKVAGQAARYEYQISNCSALKPQKFLGIF
ncbi:MAG: hypothetical protein QM773_15595 [Hyphomonadaceae bacterium]